MIRTARQDVTTDPRPKLYVALELSKDTWKLAFATSRLSKPRMRDVKARDRSGLLEEIRSAKERLGLDPATEVASCYEAGRDGFWIHRFLEASGIHNLIVDPASIEVDRRSRRAKTDRIDAQKLVRLLARHIEGEEVLRVVRVPPPEAEDERLLPRQLWTVKRKRVRVSNQIRAALFQHGVDVDPRRGNFRKEEFLRRLGQARQWDGSVLPPELDTMVRMLWEEFALLTRQIKALEQRQRKLLRDARAEGSESPEPHRKAATLTRLRGIGDTGALVLVTEFFAWREFSNRRQIASLAGLTGTPHQSGSTNTDQGISKAGNPRIRRLMVELAWLWLRWQPDSRTTRWFHEHVGKAGSRTKRKAIVAVARKLLVELWHFVEHGVIPEGAVLEPSDKQAAA